MQLYIAVGNQSNHASLKKLDLIKRTIDMCRAIKSAYGVPKIYLLQSNNLVEPEAGMGYGESVVGGGDGLR